MNPIKYLNGVGHLGLVASEKRNIKSGAQYDKYFTAPKRNDKYLSYAGTTNDTIGFMSDIIKNTLDDTKKIAQVLKGNNMQSTLSNIFNFIFEHIQYKPDDPMNEELRRPKRAWADRVTGVDCDCYSILIGSILSNLNIPFALRMVKINGKPYYQHVYVVVPKDGRQASLANNYYTVDPVLDTFNEEHPFTGKFDLYMQPIKYLNGVPDPSLNGLYGDTEPVYYSEEAAQIPDNDVVFFDGLDYYERTAPINGLGGLNGLGFLRKIWGAAKKGFKFVKKIGKKAIKKVGSVFKSNPKRKAARVQRREARKLRRVQSRNHVPQSMTSLPATSITPIGSSNGVSVTAKSMVDIARSMDKSMGIDSILNVIKAAAPDNKMVNQLIDAKSKANAGITNFEARLLAQDAAKANAGVSSVEARLLAQDAAKANAGVSTGEAQKLAENTAKAVVMQEKTDLLEKMFAMNQGNINAGSGGKNMQTIVIAAVALGLGFVVSKISQPKAA